MTVITHPYKLGGWAGSCLLYPKSFSARNGSNWYEPSFHIDWNDAAIRYFDIFTCFVNLKIFLDMSSSDKRNQLSSSVHRSSLTFWQYAGSLSSASERHQGNPTAGERPRSEYTSPPRPRDPSHILHIPFHQHCPSPVPLRPNLPRDLSSARPTDKDQLECPCGLHGPVMLHQYRSVMGSIQRQGKDAHGSYGEGLGIYGGDGHDSRLFDRVFSVGSDDFCQGLWCSWARDCSSCCQCIGSLLVGICRFPPRLLPAPLVTYLIASDVSSFSS